MEQSYYGLGEQDDELKREIESLLLAYNATSPPQSLTYGLYVEDPDDDPRYWGLHAVGDPADLFMFVVYDDESSVGWSHASPDEALISGVLDAMQRCLARQGFPNRVRMDEEHARNGW